MVNSKTSDKTVTPGTCVCWPDPKSVFLVGCLLALFKQKEMNSEKNWPLCKQNCKGIINGSKNLETFRAGNVDR